MRKSNTILTICTGILALYCSLGCSKLADNTTGFKTNACLACHTLPPDTVFHAIHPTDKITCEVCHDGYDYIGNPATPPSYHRMDTTVKFSSRFSIKEPGAIYNPESLSCKSVYCHGNFPDGKNRTVRTTDFNSVGCEFCHDTLTMVTLGHPRTDTLTWHRHRSKPIIRKCNNCHEGYSIVNGSVVDSTHINGRYDVAVMDPLDSSIIRTVKPDSTGFVDNSLYCTRCHQ